MSRDQKKKSRELYALASQLIPGGVMSNYRKLAEGATYISRGEGARVYDVDGNEYIDYNLGYGPVILGYGNEHLIQEIESQVRKLICGTTNDLQYRAAQKISDHVACAEMVRFFLSGTEANWNALRLARAYTGRDKYVRFHGHYFGSTDELLGGIVTDPDIPIAVANEREGDIWSQLSNTAGRGTNTLQSTYLIEWNDLSALENLLSDHGQEIAVVLMEPTMTNWFGCLPEPGYLEGVRELCDRYGILLWFDEVVTGFRISLECAQGHFGVIPDIATLGKGIGGGFPVSALCAKRDIMDQIAKNLVMSGGTFNGHPLTMAAVIATVEELEKDDNAAFKRIEEHGLMLKEGMEEVSQVLGANLLLQGFPGCWNYNFTPKEKTINYRDSLEGIGDGIERIIRFEKLLLERGVISSFRFYTSAAHTEREVNETLDRAYDALKQIKVEFEG
jgi:glutamate-1-semialdehyde 2,1-aminomutase